MAVKIENLAQLTTLNDSDILLIDEDGISGETMAIEYSVFKEYVEDYIDQQIHNELNTLKKNQYTRYYNTEITVQPFEQFTELINLNDLTDDNNIDDTIPFFEVDRGYIIILTAKISFLEQGYENAYINYQSEIHFYGNDYIGQTTIDENFIGFEPAPEPVTWPVNASKLLNSGGTVGYVKNSHINPSMKIPINDIIKGNNGPTGTTNPWYNVNVPLAIESNMNGGILELTNLPTNLDKSTKYNINLEIKKI